MEIRGKILIAEENEVEAALLSSVLTARGYSVLRADSGEAAVTLTALYAPDLLLLYYGAQEGGCMEAVLEIRKWSDIPIIVLSSHRSEGELISCLDSGANDYIAKPYSQNELLARIRSAMRSHRRTGAFPGGISYKNGALEIDYDKRTVAVDGKTVHLTPNEYKIMVLLSRNTGRVLTHDFIIQRLWGEYVGDSQLLRVNVANIRQKIEKNHASPEYIITEVGVGYRMREFE